MKRIIILAVTALASISCIVDNGDNSRRTNANLLFYTDQLLQEAIMVPAQQLNYLLVLDEFLKLTEEERNSPDWAQFKSGISFLEENLLRIHDKGITVDTKGTSLTETGNFWTITTGSSGTYAHTAYNYIWAGESSGNYRKLTCTEPNKYELTPVREGSETMKLSLEAIASAAGAYDFAVSGEGKSRKTGKGLSSTYEAKNFYYKRKRTTSDGTGNSDVKISYTIESVEFDVHIYQDEKELDWCKITKEPNGSMLYDCSISPSDSYYEYPFPDFIGFPHKIPQSAL